MFYAESLSALDGYIHPQQSVTYLKCVLSGPGPYIVLAGVTVHWQSHWTVTSIPNNP